MTAPFNEFGPFAVGEICRIVGTINYPELIGTEVRITELPRIVHNIDGRVWTGYGTDLVHKGYRIWPREEFLRRRRPPADSNERMYVQMWRDMADKAPQRVGETV